MYEEGEGRDSCEVAEGVQSVATGSQQTRLQRVRNQVPTRSQQGHTEVATRSQPGRNKVTTMETPNKIAKVDLEE